MQQHSLRRLISATVVAHVAAAGPCDIYASGGTPCVAAHSTTRALYSSYSGSLYQVIRGSDSATIDIKPLSAGGVSNAAAQDTFCSGTTCLISIIYDQSGQGNHLTQAPPGGAASGPEAGGYDSLSSAIGAPVTLNGKKAYGVFIPPKTGYRNNSPRGTATEDGAEGIYAVFDGTHYNNGCCFDYGNAETNNLDTGNGKMEALFFGDRTAHGYGAGSGPWVLADLENGLYTSGGDTGYGVNPDNPSVNYRFVTAVLKGNSGNKWALRGGNAKSGSLSTYWNGVRPTPNYDPMRKEGAIVLGIGGDNSNAGQGTFYEGVMTSGYPSDSTENSVQANIVAANYAAAALQSGPAINAGSTVTFRATTSPCCTAKYITHSGANVQLEVVTSSSAAALRNSASWIVHVGLGNSACLSFESVDAPGSFIRHSANKLQVNANDGSKLFASDATFCSQEALNSAGTNALRSWNFPARYWRHSSGTLYIGSNGGPNGFDGKAAFNDDVSFVVDTGFQA
ncbi:putative glycoside hydrolase family 54 protein [Rosellinia necatrix]|uniref:Alpha-L-arabinofuranosidase n=1 Tax=Rosellinia necatrix TaxID=77044 RepID=A0A1W2TWB5_ROSNE|nr:putative glycoside hydrolase family 54 protein [Rosellinia necatrix]